MNYTFKPDLTLDFYGEPFAASGRYDHLGQLVAARARGTSPLDAALPGRDFNVQSFRSNLVLRWEWRAGSVLYLVWQQDRACGTVAARAHLDRRHVQFSWPERRQLHRHQGQLLVFSQLGHALASRAAALGPCLLVVLLCAVPASAPAQTAQNGRHRADAVRVADGAIRVDGRLDDAAWPDAPVLTDFVQREPIEGSPANDRMEVRFAYDNAALYVGARMSSGAPIQAPMDRRDNGDQAEHFGVFLDTYLDRRTASAFGVTAAGVRLDEYFGSDNDEGESDYDPVWVARTSVDAQGWTAELRIPFSQLRFTDQNPQVWGLNVKRWIPSRNEEVYWALVRRTEEGWASRFGDLHGISGIRPSRRIELLPYVASGSHVFGDPAPGNPFTDSVDVDGRLGLDAKVGIGSNLTLEATVNPDFGQVEADPAEVNLSAFETFFDERRPFFLEGINLLNNQDDNWFYTRRIGAAPVGRAPGDFVDYPATSTILGAAKLTGRLQSGTSIGMLGAVTGEEFARTFSPGTPLGRVQVAPRTTYGVARMQQEFGLPGSHFALMGTAAHRALDAASESVIAPPAIGNRVQWRDEHSHARRRLRVRNARRRHARGGRGRCHRSGAARQCPLSAATRRRLPVALRSDAHDVVGGEMGRDVPASQRAPLAVAGGDRIRDARARDERRRPFRHR